MKIEMLLFAQLRDAFGAGAIAVDVERGSTAAVAAAAALSEKDAALLQLPLRYAVDGKFVDDGYPLSDGDTMALLPPVSGG